ncbi:MAG: hypothetical protein U0L54_05930 [Bacteroidales bacterium]|nr:hypothetical protein [Bacteroidales bacterium]
MEEKEYKYMVAVQCMTYNQSKYILDALNGFVMQQTNFPYVLMVVDDASTDGEQEVIKKFVSEQFDTNDTSVAYEKETDYAHITYAQHKTNKNCYIAVLYLKENHYSQRKSKMPYLAEWRDYVKYEALCEGDDYWIDAQKLQKQVDFLEENENYVLVCHRYKIFDEEEKEWYNSDGLDHIFVNKTCVTFNSKVKVWLTKTLTLMYRIDALGEYNKYEGRKIDTILNYFLLKEGLGACFNEIMGVYRLNLGGVCGKQPLKKKIKDGYLVCQDLFYYEKNRITRKKYYSYYATMFVLTKGKILFEEKFELRKFLSLPYHLSEKLIRKINN